MGGESSYASRLRVNSLPDSRNDDIFPVGRDIFDAFCLIVTS